MWNIKQKTRGSTENIKSEWETISEWEVLCHQVAFFFWLSCAKTSFYFVLDKFVKTRMFNSNVRDVLVHTWEQKPDLRRKQHMETRGWDLDVSSTRARFIVSSRFLPLNSFFCRGGWNMI